LLILQQEDFRPTAVDISVTAENVDRNLQSVYRTTEFVNNNDDDAEIDFGVVRGI
jgi:hypothetical protein